MEIQVLPEPNYPVSPEQFIGRKTASEAFTLGLQQGLAAGRISSFAVLGDWGIGKSSLLLKFAAICSDPKYGVLPVLVPVSTDYGDYRRFAESLLDGLAEALAVTSSLTTRLRTEVRNWKLKRVSMGGFTLDREAQRFFLSSGSTLLRHALGEAWKRFFLPAQISGAMFFLDDLDIFRNPRCPGCCSNPERSIPVAWHQPHELQRVLLGSIRLLFCHPKLCRACRSFLYQVLS